MRIIAKGPGGEFIGTVDNIEGNYIKMKRSDSPDGKPHYLPVDLVEKVDDDTVYLGLSKAELEVKKFDSRPEPRFHRVSYSNG